MKRNTDQHPHFFYITGADGTGKSTQAGYLVDYFLRHGENCNHIWLRFPFSLSIPFLAFARLRGYAWHEKRGKVDYGYWNFSKSWIMKNLFPWALLLDAFFAAIWKIYIPLLFNTTVVCERFVLDMLVDLSIAFNYQNLNNRLPCKFFLLLIPKESKIVFLDLDRPTICNRRPELIFDRTLKSRLLAYRNLGKQLNIPIVESYSPRKTVFRKIQIEMKLDE